MKRVQHTPKDTELLARLMRAEALGEGGIGMLLVGSVVANRIVAQCYGFDKINNVNDAVYQNPGGFASINTPLFNSRTNNDDLALAQTVLDGKRFQPAENALFFYAPKPGEECSDEWFGAKLTGRYKKHCFYAPSPEECPELYGLPPNEETEETTQTEETKEEEE